jgi:excisionase family DNA binding protein
MWQRFTEKARQIVFRAQEQAIRFGSPYVTPEHLLLGMTVVEGNMGLRILEASGFPPQELRDEIEAQLPHDGGEPGKDLMLTPRAKKVVDLAYEAAKELKHDYIGGEHLLLGILSEGESMAAMTLTKHGITANLARLQLQQLRDSDVRAANTEELMTLDEAVQFLNTSKPTLYRVLGQGDLKGLKVGRQWRFRKADLVAYMERSPVAVAAAPGADLDEALVFFLDQLRPYGHTLVDPQEFPPAGEAFAPSELKTIQLANAIALLAISQGASDVHLEAARFEGLNCSWLRMRIDGVLQETLRMPISIHEGLVTRLKVMADMNLTEKRIPQDGRIPIRHGDKDLDFRVSIVPAFLGETVVMRIFDRGNMNIGLEKLGLAASAQRTVHRHRPDRERQDDAAVQRSGRIGAHRSQDDHYRRPRRTADAADDAGPGQQACRGDVCRCPPVVFAARPGHHLHRRDA